MLYNGKELKEITEPQVFNPPKWMLVSQFEDDPIKRQVVAIIKKLNGEVRALADSLCDPNLIEWNHCAEIPGEAPELATNLQLAEWLAKGNGQMQHKNGGFAYSCIACKLKKEQELAESCLVRKWGDTEWHEPTLEYMGIGEGA